MHILLTGAFGNIGSSTLQELIRQGHTVRCFDIKTQKTEKVAKRFQLEPNVEVVWGDLRQAEQVAAAVANQEVIVHFGAILPPEVDKDPTRAEAVNVGGTKHLLAAATQQEHSPKFLLASSLDVFGYTQDKEPPRKVTDPVVATDNYTRHKLECESMLKASGLEWAIFRFADVPPLEPRNPDPIMFTIPLDTRFEMLHTHDAGLAVANGVKSQIWGQIWLIGGGASCQVYYRDYLREALKRAGIGMLPESAFGHDPYCTDWLDTSVSQALLQYQRHTFDEIMNDLPFPSGATKVMLSLISPLVRRSILRWSPYMQSVTR
jgi:nucleoside-diphosphate-sugar epimerase